MNIYIYIYMCVCVRVCVCVCVCVCYMCYYVLYTVLLQLNIKNQVIAIKYQAGIVLPYGEKNQRFRRLEAKLVKKCNFKVKDKR